MCIYIYTYTGVYIYIYIYIERERDIRTYIYIYIERERCTIWSSSIIRFGGNALDTSVSTRGFRVVVIVC